MPSRYVLYGLRSSESELASRATGSTFGAIGGSELRAHGLPLAPLNEQHRIVAEIEKQLTRLDAAAASLQRVRANLKRYRSAVLKAACEGRLVPTEAELARAEGRDYEPADQLLARILQERRARWEATQLAKLRGRAGCKDDETVKDVRRDGGRWKIVYPAPLAPDGTRLLGLPKGWVWATVDQLSFIQGGIQKQPKRAPRQYAFPFLRVANVPRGRVDLREIHQIELFGSELEKLRLESGDLLVVEGNGSPSEIGRMAIWPGTIEDCVHQNHIIRVRLLAELQPKYVETYWNSPSGTAAVTRIASSTSGLYTLSVSKLSRLTVPLPPLPEQLRIVAEVERRLSVIDELEATVAINLKRAERMRQSILKRAFEGKLVHQDPRDEPASVLLERIRTERNGAASGTGPGLVRRPRNRRGPR